MFQSPPKLLQVTMPKPAYPASPVPSLQEPQLRLLFMFSPYPSLCLLSDPGASPCGPPIPP